jgi:hypothetical protein
VYPHSLLILPVLIYLIMSSEFTNYQIDLVRLGLIDIVTNASSMSLHWYAYVVLNPITIQTLTLGTSETPWERAQCALDRAREAWYGSLVRDIIYNGSKATE